jgi:2-polyprenyl-3-methyl-5-hydroxy-6-metoxy-1,4-benzoquinol methylase
MSAMAEATSSASEQAEWDRHWSAYAESNVLNPAQTYRKELIFERLDLGRATRRPRVLDIGSGQGELSREIKRRHPDAEIAGLDLSSTGLEEARRTVPGARFFQQDIMRPLAWQDLDGWATHAVCSEVLEHVADPVHALANVRPALGADCRLVITVPSGPMSAFDRHIGHLRHFTAGSLETTLRHAGYSTVEVNRAGFPFFNLYRLTVVARGRKLIDDAAAGERELPVTARLAMQVFGTLFRFNSTRANRGWQLVAVARP